MHDIIQIHYNNFPELANKIDEDGREVVQVLGLEKPTPLRKTHRATILFRDEEKSNNE